jgi:glycerol-3-phosphate responsive antiterminator
MEPLTILAIGKFLWDVATDIREWCKEAEAHPDLVTGTEKHNHVLKKVAEKVESNGTMINKDEVIQLASGKIDEVVKAYHDNGIFKGRV